MHSLPLSYHGCPLHVHAVYMYIYLNRIQLLLMVLVAGNTPIIPILITKNNPVLQLLYWRDSTKNKPQAE